MAGCRCDHVQLIVDPPPPTDECVDCLWVTSPIITCDNSVGPCGEEGTASLESNCTNPVYTIIFADPAFTNVDITGGALTYDTVSAELSVPETYYQICYKVTCADAPFDGLSVIGCARICIKNLCSGVSCVVGQVCDPCDGTCGPAAINLGLNIN